MASHRNTHEKKQQEMDRLMQMLEEGIDNYLHNGQFESYLRFISRFHMYSPRNSMLIMLQRPEATMVASFMDWKKKFRRYVRSGEHGIRIIAPIASRPAEEEEDDEPRIVGFRAATVFDVSQTEGEALPELCMQLRDEVADHELLFAACSTLTDFEIVRMDLPADTFGVCMHQEHRIGIKKDISQSMQLKTLFHEIAHSRLHPYGTELSREMREIQAESVAYILCAHLGIDSGGYSFGYLVSWGAADRPHFFRAAMPAVVSTAREMISLLDRELERHRIPGSFAPAEKPEEMMLSASGKCYT